MRKSDTNKWKQQLIPFFIFLLIGITAGYFIGRSLDGLSARFSGLPYPLVLAALLIFFYVALGAQLILHEAGHLVCGLISGYRFSSFRVGSLMLFQEGKRLRFKTLSIAGTGGQCLMLPPQCDDTPIPFRLYLLGGVLRTQYAAALLHDHDAAKAAEILATLDRMAARYPYVSDIASERELLSAVRSKSNVN